MYSVLGIDMAQPRKPTARKRAKKLTTWQKILPRIRLMAFVLGLVVLTAGLLAGWTWVWNNTISAQAILRDVVVTLVAHTMAGGNIPIVGVDYSGGQVVNKAEVWGIESNSLWLVRETMKIVPLLVYEDIGAGKYPEVVVFVPYIGERSFHVAGTMQCQQSDVCIVYLNERYVTDPSWNDMRGLLTTLTHEIIHRQGGLFLDDPEVSDWPTKSAHLESRTSAATTETLAAMCNFGNKLACRSFWAEIESMARVNLRYRLHDYPGAYDLFANIFLRNDEDEREARKRNRFWSQHEDELYDIMLKYSVDPYENHLIFGLKYGRPLVTDVLVWDEFDNLGNPLRGHRLLMSWDDTSDVLGPLVWWMTFLTH